MTRRSLFPLGLVALPAFAAKTPVRLGGPIFLRSSDPAELAREHRRLGYSAAYCPQATVQETELVRAIVRAFAAENVAIAEVGAWKNMLDPDAVKRKQNLEYVVERCALADAVGARCCVDIAGVVQRGRLVRDASEESFEGVLRRHGGELPACPRCSETEAHEIHHRDDAVELARWSGTRTCG